MATMPVERGFIVTSHFGPRWGTTHYGTDFGRPGGSGGYPVYAVRAGRVTHAGPATGFGRWVVIDHPASVGGGTSVYGHVVPEVSVGTQVREGQRIARIDPNSSTNGGVDPHLHLEWHRYGYAPPGPDRLDPMATILKGARWPGEASSPQVSGPHPVIYGVDISNHQKGIDVAQIAREGFKFAIIKATEGTWQDPTCRNFVRESKAAGLLTAVYVYVRQERGAEEHAQALDEVLQGDTTIPVALDIEEKSGSSPATWRAIRDAIEARGYRVILTYCPRWYWQRVGQPDLSGLPPLWTSHYGSAPEGYASVIYAQRGRQGWDGYGGLPVAVWQFTEKAQVAGQRIDANAYEGGLEALRQLFAGAPTTPPTPEETSMSFTASDRALLERVHHELTHRFQSRYRDPESGERSQHRETLVGYVLDMDRKVEDVHAHTLPGLVKALDWIGDALERILKVVKK